MGLICARSFVLSNLPCILNQRKIPSVKTSVKWRSIYWTFLTEIFIWECWKWCFRASRLKNFGGPPSILRLCPWQTAMWSKIPMRYYPKVGEKNCLLFKPFSEFVIKSLNANNFLLLYARVFVVVCLSRQVYHDQAEDDKRRYLEELSAYQQSGAYQAFLKRQQSKKLKDLGKFLLLLSFSFC